MNNDTIRVLIVDDQELDREWLAAWLRKNHSFEVDTAQDGSECLAQIHESQGNYDVVLLDMQLRGGMSGSKTMKEIQARYEHIETIIITGFGGVEDGIKALKEGAYNFVFKPLNHDLLVVYIRSAAERRRLKADLNQTAQKRDWLQGLLEVSQALNLSLEPGELARGIYERARPVIPKLQAFYIALYNEAYDELRFLLTVDKNEIVDRPPQSLSDKDKWGFSGYIVKTGEPLYYDDLEDPEISLPVSRIVYGYPARAFIGLPLVSRDKVIGVLSVQSYEAKAFNEDHRRLIESIANQSAVAIENAILHKQTERRAKVLSNLYNTLTQLRTSPDPDSELDSILDPIVGNLQESFALDTCTIGLFDETLTRLDFVAVRGLPQKVSRPVKDLPDELTSRVYASNDLIEILDVDRLPGLKKALVRPDLKSFSILPLRGKTNPIGIITMGSTGKIDLPPDQNELLQTLAEHVATTLENASLHKETLAWARQLDTLDELALEIAKPRDMEELLQKIIYSASALLRGAGGAIYLLSENQDYLELKASLNMPDTLGGRHIGKDRGVAGQVIRTKQPFIKTNYREWEERLRSLDKLDLEIVIGVPIISPTGDLLGVITVHDTKQDREFSPLDEKALLRFGRHAGVAIQNARMSHLLEERQATDEISQALVSVLNYEEFLNKVLRVLHRRFGYTLCAVLLKDEIKNELYVKEALNYPKDVKQNARILIDPDKGVISRVAETGMPAIISDVTGSKHISRLSDVRSEIAVPLKVGEDVIGVLDVLSTKPNDFNDRDKRILIHAAAAIAIAAEVNEKTNRLGSLLSFSKTVAEAQNLEEALNIVAETIIRACPSTFCAILLRTRDNRNLRVRAACPMPRDNGFDWNPRIGEICHLFSKRDLEKFVSGKPNILLQKGDGHSDRYLKRIANHLSLKAPLQSALVIPLSVGTEILGLCVLCEMRKWERGPFIQKNIDFAMTLAAHSTAQIEKARGFVLEHERTQTLDDLNKVANALSATLGLDEVLNLIVSYGRKLLNSEVASVFVVRREGFLSLEADSGSASGSFKRGTEVEIKTTDEAGLTGRIAAAGKLFNKHGKELLRHIAASRAGLRTHIPSGECTSLLAIPLKRQSGERDELIGLIKAENKKDRLGDVERARGFDDVDTLILRTLAIYAEKAITNAQLADLANMSQRVRQVVSSTLDLDEVLQRVLTELRNLLPFQTSYIQLLENSTSTFASAASASKSASAQFLEEKQLRIVAAEGFNEEEMRKVLQLVTPLNPKLPNYEVISKKKPLLLPDIRASKYRHFGDEANVYVSDQAKSWLGVPLLHGDEAIGMLSIESDASYRYTKVHEDIGMVFASQIVPAVVNARLYESTQSLLYESTQSLLRIHQDITKELDLDTVLKTIAEDAVNKEGIGADIAIIYLYNPDRSAIDGMPVHAGRPLAYPEKISPPLGEDSVVHRLLKSAEPYVILTASGDHKLDNGFMKREGVKSAAGFKLLVGSQPVGLMFVNYLTPHTFSKPELGLISLFAQQAGIAIQNARQYGGVNTSLQVAKTFARAGMLASIFAHDVKSPTLSIRALVNIIDSQVEDLNIKNYLARIDRHAKLIADSFPAFPKRPEVVAINLGKILQEVLEKRKEEFSQYNIQVKTNLDQMPPVKGDSWMLAFVIDNMINNAVRFLQGGGTLAFRGHKANRRLLLDIIDSGPGVSEAVLPQLYKGAVLDPESKGNGYGLLLIKHILNELDGDIGLPTRDERGNVFTIDLPLV